MDIGYAILKGLVQGIAEFIPISSTAHLILVNALYQVFGWHLQPLHPVEEEFFDILLHMGTLTAVLIYFRSDLLHIIKAAFSTSASLPSSAHSGKLGGGWRFKTLPVYLALSLTVTIALTLGFLKGSEKLFEVLHLQTATIHDLSDFYLQHPAWVGFHLFLTGCLLTLSEWLMGKRQQQQTEASSEALAAKFSLKNALWIGAFQGFAAIFHGISRSGSTIVGGMLSGLDRLTATRYSFLLSIPTFLAAMAYESLKVFQHNIGHQLNWAPMLAGTFVSGIVGYVCVSYFIRFVATRKLSVFAWYCWIVGGSMFFFFSSHPTP